MNRITKAAIGTVAVSGLVWGLGFRPASARVIPAHIPVKLTCATYVIEGQPPVGMPFNEPEHFCGVGIRQGTWDCPAASPVLGPGSQVNCILVTKKN